MGRKDTVDQVVQRFVDLDLSEVSSEEEWRSFEEWEKENPEGMKLFRRLEKIAFAARTLKDPEDYSRDAGPVVPQIHWTEHIRLGSPSFSKFSVLAVLAALGLLAAWRVFIYPNHSNTALDWQSFETSLGEHRHVVFKDGSIAELNTDTALRARVSSGHRETTLERGEALFHVAHDPGYPFVVNVREDRIEALGTAFDVSNRPDHPVRAVVTEGKVGVRAPSQEVIVVTAQNAVTITSGAVEVVALKPEELNRRLAWTRDELVFDHQPLEEVVAEFNRYNKDQLQIVDSRIRKLEVAGTYHSGEPLRFAELLEQGLRARFSVHKSGDGHRIIELIGPTKAE